MRTNSLHFLKRFQNHENAANENSRSQSSLYRCVQFDDKNNIFYDFLLSYIIHACIIKWCLWCAQRKHEKISNNSFWLMFVFICSLLLYLIERQRLQTFFFVLCTKYNVLAHTRIVHLHAYIPFANGLHVGMNEEKGIYWRCIGNK